MPLAPRWGQPSDTADLVSWLVSDASGWITGQTVDSEAVGAFEAVSRLACDPGREEATRLVRRLVTLHDAGRFATTWSAGVSADANSAR